MKKYWEKASHNHNMQRSPFLCIFSLVVNLFKVFISVNELSANSPSNDNNYEI